MNRVVVTGIGLITPIGIGTAETWNNLIEGKCGVGHVTTFDTSDMPVNIAAEIKGFEPTEFGIEKKEVKKMARNTQLAIAASKLAIEDAKLVIDETNANDIGCYVSSGIGGMEVFCEQHQALIEKGPRRVSPFTIPALISNMAAGNVAIYYGAKGPNKCIVTACSSGTHSIGDAFETIKLGRAKAIICGGVEGSITKFSMAAFANMKALSTRNDEPEKASRPFNVDRDGFVMGEGAGVLILEDLEFAKARGAKIYAEVVGYGETNDAHHITAPAVDGAVRSFNMALKEAGLKPSDVDYVNAHGTSTPMNDKNETAALKEVFGDHVKDLLVSSTKGATGHGLGAAGGMEGAFIALAIKEGIVPPTINYENPDPECDLNYVPNKAVKKDINVAISDSLGFGGHNGVIIMKKY